MKKRILLITLLSMVIAGCDDPPPIQENPSGTANPAPTETPVPDPNRDRSEVTTKELTLEPFEALDVKGGFEVNVTQGETQKVELEVNKDSIDKVTATVADKSLKINTPDKFNAGHCTIKVTIPALKAISAEGTVLIKGTDITTDSLSIAAKGTCTVELTGSVENLTATAGDGVSLRLKGLDVKNCTINVNGKSFSQVKVSGNLTANAQDGSVIHYWGNPQIQSTVGKQAFLKKQR